jgi:hypothetical protein
MSPIRNLNEMEQHDGNNQEINFGGPHELVVMLNGEELYRGEVGKAHSLHIHTAPKGEGVDDGE